MLPMKRILLTSLIFAMPVLASTGAAADCTSAAQKAASQANAELLSVEASGSDCKVKLLLPGKNGEPPRVVTKKVKG